MVFFMYMIIVNLIFLFVFAALNGHKDVVALLLDNNANINHQDLLGRTALMIAGKKSF